MGPRRSLESAKEKNAGVESSSRATRGKDTSLGKRKSKPVTVESTVTKATPKKKKPAKKPIEEDDDEGSDASTEYEVKEVIDSKKEKNVVYYLIRWKGFSAADDTWERATDLSCDDLIEAFNKKKKPNAKKPIKEDEDEESDASTEYEVKEVIDSKKENNVLYYLIRWKGYGKADDTWERATDLSCNSLIAEFKNKNQNKPKKASSSSTAAAKQPPKKKKKDEEYVVEKIISMLENKKGKMFRIRWKGFKSTQDTWEPEENLNCTDLIERFLLKNEKTPKEVTTN